MLVYTSGTTGNPKGVQVTHLMYVPAGQGFAYWTHATSRTDFFSCPFPISMLTHNIIQLWEPWLQGPRWLGESRFSASRFWSQVKKSRATVVNFIGMMMPVLSKQPSSHDDREKRSSLILWISSFFEREIF
ncbi:MAG: hypothetical protein CM1200mP35_03840 [Chloroflexota bacterium]|nr:MAG: hypothetical protein CM1200mP35_03840 [Chloroflexota bacterium]